MLVQQSCSQSTSIYFEDDYSYSCGSQVKAQPSSGHIFQPRSCVRSDYPSEAMEIVSYCTKSGRMSRKLVSGKYLFINYLSY